MNEAIETRTDYVARLLIENYTERFAVADPYYLEGKVKCLEKLNREGAIREIFQLDTKGELILARQLEIEWEELLVWQRVMRHLL
jgi:hypothetical protein